MDTWAMNNYRSLLSPNAPPAEFPPPVVPTGVPVIPNSGIREVRPDGIDDATSVRDRGSYVEGE